LLRIIAGLENPENGKIFWDGKDLTDVPPYKRNFGFMFQDYALFPHMNVQKNVAFGLEMKGMPRDVIKKIVEEKLELVEMGAMAERNVADLSGGEKQRVALARALAPEPWLLMLDEPLGSLDRTLREQLILELGVLLKELETPVIYVTHDQEEAFSIGSRLAVLHQTAIIQSDTPENVYSNPASLWLAGFLGFSNRLEGVIESSNPLCISTKAGFFSPVGKTGFMRIGEGIILVFKPDGLMENPPDSKSNLLKGLVIECLFFGGRYKLLIEIENGKIFTFFGKKRFNPGEPVEIALDPASILCYSRANV
jgi:ABC-type Fe3+/spermidine/putrescine transport system ATPase subunit